MLSHSSFFFLKLPGFAGESWLNFTFNRLNLKLAPIAISLLNIITYYCEGGYGEELRAYVLGKKNKRKQTKPP